MDSHKSREWLSGNAIYTPAFVKSHAEEITAMVNSINHPQNNKLLHQTLPISMRRRAMSHNPKRIPRKYRRVHQSQMSKGGDPAPTKRPSRRYRRRPSNLMKEYMRRRMKNVWLETHIWYAKRFHMTNRFGYRLPLSACAKSYRSSYRATARYCLLQDISYVGCIEITGPIDILSAGFRRMTSSKCGLTLMAKIYSAGSREGRVDLFKADSYPEQSLGSVSFVWRQVMGETETRSLWIYAHPTFYRELVQELCVVFDLKNLSKVAKEDMEVDGGQKQRVDRNIRNPKYANAATNVSMEELKDTLNRFRLTGPLSQAILHKSLRPAQISGDNWLSKWSEGKREAVHASQAAFWDATETVASPAELSSHLVLTLNAEDPRIHRPGIRKRALPKIDDELRYNPAVVEVPKNAAVSAIWSSKIRRKLVEEMLTTHQYNKLREKHVLVPGEPSDFEQRIQPVSGGGVNVELIFTFYLNFRCP
jgi:ribonuclease P/MRP protein subunit POP1